MTTTLETPRVFVESIAEMRLPEKSDKRLQDLMDRNNEGRLLPQEREELESLAELSESIGLLRSQAMIALGRTPV